MVMACVMVIVVQKRFEFEFLKTPRPAFFEKFKKSSSVVVVIGGFGELFFITKMSIITKFVTNITSLILEKQWGNNGKVMVEQKYGAMDGPASLVVDKVGWVASGDWRQGAVNKAVFEVLRS